jgi:hypothetical protein
MNFAGFSIPLKTLLLGGGSNQGQKKHDQINLVVLNSKVSSLRAWPKTLMYKCLI